jgi:hypothetical protein
LSFHRLSNEDKQSPALNLDNAISICCDCLRGGVSPQAESDVESQGAALRGHRLQCGPARALQGHRLRCARRRGLADP